MSKLDKDEQYYPSSYYPYSKKATLDSDIELELMKGGAINGSFKEFQQTFEEKKHRYKSYFDENLQGLLRQKTKKRKLADIKIEKIHLQLNAKPLISKKNIYTDYFGKKGFFYFMKWVRTHQTDTSKYIYVVAHSNIMLETVVNVHQILGKMPGNFFDNFESIIAKQNIWELIFKVEDEKEITQIIIREGEDPPTEVSIMNLEDEVNCFRSRKIPISNNCVISGGKKQKKTKNVKKIYKARTRSKRQK